MEKIDAHQHCWQFDAARDTWIRPDMGVIRRDFMPLDLEPELQKKDIAGTVLVQTCQDESDNVFMLALAARHHFIRGIVGWVDLLSPGLERRLAYYYGQHPLMKGFRHVLQSEADDQFMLRSDFLRGIGLLGKYGFTYDLLIYPRHLPYAARLTAQFPGQRFIVDHIAKPMIRSAEIREWEKDIRELARQPHVYCKVSGMLTEADWQAWKPADLRPYLDVLFDAFGPARLIYGSDWPVCLLAGGYGAAFFLLSDYLSSCSKGEQEMFFGSNAAGFYRL